MSSITLQNLTYITPQQLSSLLQTTPSSTAIVDVRDSDYIGGHIKGCLNVPTNTLDYKLPELVRTLGSKEVVVFHCALSQQRGPKAALGYLRERERVGEKGKGMGEKEGGQKVFVLDGGFVKWQELYGEDESLTEGYQKDIWEFGY